MKNIGKKGGSLTVIPFSSILPLLISHWFLHVSEQFLFHFLEHIHHDFHHDVQSEIRHLLAFLQSLYFSIQKADRVKSTLPAGCFCHTGLFKPLHCARIFDFIPLCLPFYFFILSQHPECFIKSHLSLKWSFHRIDVSIPEFFKYLHFFLLA